MPQPKPKKRLNPKLDGVVERGIRVAREKFERAFIKEWDARLDSATVRNATGALPYRCRQCGKRVAGLSDVCVCRTKIESVRFLSNPQDVFRKLFQQRCGGIATSASLADFTKIVTSIAVANDRDLNWVEGQIQRLLPLVKCLGRDWAIGVCPAPLGHIGVLPAWFNDNRQEIPETDLQRGLSAEETEAELGGLEAEIEQHFGEARTALLDQAGLQMAQVVRLAPEPRTRARQDLFAAMVARVKRNNPEAPIEKICQILDGKRCSLRPEDRRAGFKSWHEAWKDLRNRNRMKRFISSIQPAAPEKKV